ncbi:hypothetical protein ANO11243_046380 [Dothideomycetidae sp. 11243]|nr:hypothetical protein ANO11243_046380 [fungal sp. No.11243]
MAEPAGHVARAAIFLSERATTSDSRPPIYKVIGLVLAICSGLFIGVSFVVKKIGLLQANKKYNQAAGEGYGYLKNWMWWTGMTLMILGETCNFVAYAFVDAILVTPLGALSVVVTTILSAIFLKERLSFVGKLGCFNCIVGSVVIVLNAPGQSAVSKIQDMQHYVISPGFLTYAGIIVIGASFTAFWVGPRYGKKTMLVYLSICSWVGGLSVVATQGLGAAIVTQISGTPQFNQWFLYVLLVFVICTLVTEIIYLNKALNLFNAALVTPTYYVYFTSTTILTSAILFRGFKGTAISITTVVLGFLQICTGVVLLQLAKSSKDVPDTAIFKGDLDQVRTIAEQEEPEFEPRADTIRGGGALLRAVSQRRARREADEAKTLLSETMEPIGEDEAVEWDGLRRRKTILGSNPPAPGSLQRAKTLHPPLGMSRFPDETASDAGSDDVHSGFFPRFGRRSTRRANQNRIHVTEDDKSRPIPGSRLRKPTDGADDTAYHSPSEHIRWDRTTPESPLRNPEQGPPRPPPHRVISGQRTASAKRTFSFQNVFNRQKAESESGRHKNTLGKMESEEERLGLVKGDSRSNVPAFYDSSPITSPERPLMHSHQDRIDRDSNLRVSMVRDSDDEWQLPSATGSRRSNSPAVPGRDFGVLSASDNSNNSGSEVVVSPSGEALNVAAGAPVQGRGTPRRGYQRGRYVDSDDEGV